MELKKELEGSILTFILSGDLNSDAAPALEKEVEDLSNITELYFDLTKLDYLASAGLRVFLKCQKTMDKQGGKMVIKNANDLVKEVFNITGLKDVFTTI